MYVMQSSLSPLILLFTQSHNCIPIFNLYYNSDISENIFIYVIQSWHDGIDSKCMDYAHARFDDLDFDARSHIASAEENISGLNDTDN